MFKKFGGKMTYFGLILSIVLTLFSSVVLAYISMATMIGPFIAPTLVLIAGLALRLCKKLSVEQRNKKIALIQTAGSVGGIAATAVGFTLPTLYFLDKARFEAFISNPLQFCLIIGAICLSSGSFGILLGRAFNKKLLVKEGLNFPISHMICKTITSQNQSNQTKQLIAGFSLSGIICFFRDFSRLDNGTIFLFKSFVGHRLPIMIVPMLWAIGFITGTSFAIPLLVGMISKYLVLSPLNNHSLYLPFKLFPIFDRKVFGMAFCSGLALAGVLPMILKYPSIIWNGVKQYSGYSYIHRFSSIKNFFKKLSDKPFRLFTNLEAIFAATSIIMLFHFLKFPLFSLISIIPLTIIAAYNISYIGGKIGLVQIGRFVTFVMIPTMLLFKLTSVQITIICVFVGIAITVASDILFDYKVGDLCEISHKQIHRYQWLGLVVTAIGLGFFFWLILSNLQLGTAQLFAQRGKSRALLIQSFNFNLIVVFLGFLYGLILKKFKISPAMVFGGILMPNGLTLGLVFGALGTLFVKDKKELFPFFSGIFAGESIWLVLNILGKII